jgi:hypothetical protein
MRAQAHASRVGDALHAIEVGDEPRAVDQYLWSREVGDAHGPSV